MQWSNASEEKPGFSLYTADDPDNPGHHYVIQRKRDITAGVWRLAFRPTPDETLRIIFLGNSMQDCKDYAETFKAEHATQES